MVALTHPLWIYEGRAIFLPQPETSLYICLPFQNDQSSRGLPGARVAPEAALHPLGACHSSEEVGFLAFGVPQRER